MDAVAAALAVIIVHQRTGPSGDNRMDSSTSRTGLSALSHLGSMHMRPHDGTEAQDMDLVFIPPDNRGTEHVPLTPAQSLKDEQAQMQEDSTKVSMQRMLGKTASSGASASLSQMLHQQRASNVRHSSSILYCNHRFGILKVGHKYMLESSNWTHPHRPSPKLRSIVVPLQIMDSISDDLGISVLRFTHTGLPGLLSCVSTSHHPLVLRALCPSIDAKSSLSLSHTDASAALSALVASSALTQLTSLSSHQQLLPSGAFPKAFSCLSSLQCLQRLDLSEMRIRADGAPALANALTHLTSLRELNLDMSYISQEGMCTLGPAMLSLQKLTSLRMMTNLIGDVGVEALAVPLSALTALQALILDINEIGSEGMIALEPALKRLDALTHLSLGGNSIGEAGAVPLANAVSSLTALQVLDVEGNNIEQNGAAALSRAVPGLQQLRAFKLSMNHVCVNGCMALALSLAAPDLTSLAVLDLSRNHVCDGGCASLAAALSAMPSLASLNLWWNFITAEGITTLAEHLPVLSSTLKHLDVGGNQFGDRGAQSMARYLPCMTALESLRLERCKLQATGARAVASSLTGIRSLKMLDMSDNRFLADATVDAQAVMRDVLGGLQQAIPDLDLRT